VDDTAVAASLSLSAGSSEQLSSSTSITSIAEDFAGRDLDPADEEQLEYVDFCDGTVRTGRQTTRLTTVGPVLEIVKQLKLFDAAERGKVSDKCSLSGAGRTELDTEKTGMTV